MKYLSNLLLVPFLNFYVPFICKRFDLNFILRFHESHKFIVSKNDFFLGISPLIITLLDKMSTIIDIGVGLSSVEILVASARCQLISLEIISQLLAAAENMRGSQCY